MEQVKRKLMKNYITHDEAIELALIEYEKADKRRYTDIFLASLSRRKKNIVLPTLAYFKTFPKHKLSISQKTIEFYGEENADKLGCEICGLNQKSEFPIAKFKGNFDCAPNFNRYEMLLTLQETNALIVIPKPTDKDFEIFKSLIGLLKNTELKIVDFSKEFKKTDIFKEWVMLEKGYKKEKGADYEYVGTPTNRVYYNFCYLLGHLGYLGILHTDKHKGAFYEFTKHSGEPRPARNSDFSYPVSFWSGSDGVDMNALRYWFSDYEELKELF